jgi:hypothetical protein
MEMLELLRMDSECENRVAVIQLKLHVPILPMIRPTRPPLRTHHSPALSSFSSNSNNRLLPSLPYGSTRTEVVGRFGQADDEIIPAPLEEPIVVSKTEVWARRADRLARMWVLEGFRWREREQGRLHADCMVNGDHSVFQAFNRMPPPLHWSFHQR